MTSELENKLRNLAAKGELTYLSVIPVAGIGEYGCTFVAQIAPASRFGHVEGRDADPVQALVNALDALPKSFVKETAPQRGGKKAAEQRVSANVEPWDVV